MENTEAELETGREIARFNAAIREANEAFWRKITRYYPEVAGQDGLPPDAQTALREAQIHALSAWIEYNRLSDRKRRDEGNGVTPPSPG